MDPYVSIIIPFNKGKRYLKDCLESLKEQQLKNLETILIMNGVEENIENLIIKYSEDLNLKFISFKNEIGVSKARNEGLKLSQGKYVYFLDSDDYLYNDALSKLVKVAKKYDFDIINGERINTAYIKDRFEEQLNKKIPFKKDNLSEMEFSMKLLVSQKTNAEEILSVLHSLIKRNIIKNLKFDENKRFHSDYEFMIKVIDSANTFYGVENSIYAKRTRDDPINLTSLNQEPKKDSFLLYYTEYKKVYDYIKNKSDEKFIALKYQINEKLFNVYYNKFSNNFMSNPNKKWRKEYFDAISDISKGFNNDYSFFIKQELKALQNNNKNKLKKLIRLRLINKKFKKMIKQPWRFNTLIYTKFYNKKPIKNNKIIFESFRGDFYSDSPKYLYEYLYENHKDDFEFVWVIDNQKTEIPGNPKKVKRFSLNFYKELAQSKYWVINGRQAARLKKRKNQVIISTWHGTPLKKLGLDMDNVYTEDPRIKQSYIKVAKQWKYLISPNRYTTNIFKSAFNYQGTIIESGYPRNDILYNANENYINQIKMDLSIPKDKKIILYAPTWRDDEFYDIGKVKFKLQLDIDKLKKELSDEYVLLVRTHYFIADNLDLDGCEGFAYDVSKYDDIAELYLISDILITDYSSVFFDFANLKKPILFYTYDLDKYENILRGFYIDIHSEVPGPLLFTSEEVIESIKDIRNINKIYSVKYNEFYDKFCSIEDGDASKRIYDEIWGK